LGLAPLTAVSRILVLNPGSSSIKASVVESPGDVTRSEGNSPWSADPDAAESRAGILAASVDEVTAAVGAEAIDAVGYRVVHGGRTFLAPTQIDDAVVDELAPLHNRIAADAIRAARRLMPDLPHVACFDTAFHATLDEPAWRYPVPAEWLTRWGVRRFGFHGLSVAWATERAADLLERPVEALQLVVAHLGSGSSVSAVAGGRSVDTSMGFTPLEGLMMGTRSGSLDPGILLFLLRHGMGADDLADALEHRSGLLGVSGHSADVAELEGLAAAGNADAELAMDLYARRAAAGIAAMATALSRLDAIVFTGGIGEHSAATRRRICDRLATLGVQRPEAGGNGAGDRILVGEAVATVVIHAREDLVIARQAAELLFSR
jgi:acetate kinase